MAQMAGKIGVLPEDWLEGQLLGEGGFGSVYRCLRNDRIELPYAAKKLEISRKEDRHFAALEIDVLQRVSHKYVIQYHEFVVRGVHVYIIMDHMPRGSLTDLVRKHRPLKRLLEAEAQRYTRQIVEGLHYLHSKDIIHRDIKGANILLDEESNVKLADFGLAKILFPGGTISGQVMERAGTYQYMSPEMLLEQGYGRRTDVWSLGSTLVEMLAGHAPWQGFKLAAFVGEIRARKAPAYELPAGTSADAVEMLNKCFIWDKHARPDTAQLLKLNFCEDKTPTPTTCGCKCAII